ncbi:MAG: class I SAM-dependent methyltransferase, partial [Henriciella sp.]
MTASPPKLFDARQVQMHRDRAAQSYADYDFLKRRESSRLIERLEDVSREFARALDFGGHDGTAAELLAGHRQVGSVEVAESSPAMRALAEMKGLKARPIEGDDLGLPGAEYDLVTSILTLHWVNDLPGALVQIRQALKP